MSKVLVLELDNEYGMMRNTNECDYHNYFKYNNNNKIQKVLKKTCLFLAQRFFGEWKRKIKSYDICILFDRGFNKLVSKYIKKQNPRCKVILWLWNPITLKHEKFLKDKNVDEIWTYDENDAKKYNIYWNTQFYNKEFVKEYNSKNIKYDVMFIGNNKGRDKIIKEYEEKFDNIKLNTLIRIINNYGENIKYTEYLKYLGESKAVLEIVKDNVSGLTLRALESIFFRKKLITNNKFVKKYKFYNKNNVFILEEDEICNFKKFINSEYTDLNEENINYYDFEEWVKRFYMEKK